MSRELLGTGRSAKIAHLAEQLGERARRARRRCLQQVQYLRALLDAADVRRRSVHDHLEANGVS